MKPTATIVWVEGSMSTEVNPPLLVSSLLPTILGNRESVQVEKSIVSAALKLQISYIVKIFNIAEEIDLNIFIIITF